MSVQISWGSTVDASLAAIHGGHSDSEDALQRLLAAKRAALMQRLDPDGVCEAAFLQQQLQHSPLHNRALSPTKERSSPSKPPLPPVRRLSVRPASATAIMFSSTRDENAIGGGSGSNTPLPEAFGTVDEDDDHAPPHTRNHHASAALPSSRLPAASSPTVRRMERFAAIDAHTSHVIHTMHAHAQAAAATPGEPPLQISSPPQSRPSTATSRAHTSSLDIHTHTSSSSSSMDAAERANRADFYYVQVQVDNSTCGFADRFDCVLMTHDGGGSERRPLTASFPQLLMSKDRYLLFPGKPKMWQGLPTDKVFGSGVARMTDFDPRTVLSLSEYVRASFSLCIFVTI